MVICKACGFITEKGKLHDVCPACGVKAAMFQPQDERISPRRKRLLSLDLHPVLVHFPQAFCTTVLALSWIVPFVHGTTGAAMRGTIQILGIALPVTVLAAFAGGIFDGNIRFKKVSTPILKTKIILGLVFFAISLAMAVLAHGATRAAPVTLVMTGVLGLCGIATATLLGLLGTSLLHARFPG